MDMDLVLIKKLREKTGAGFQDCQRALEEANNCFETAIEILRKRGQKIAADKSERITKNGVIGVYLHSNERVAAMVELACETDFVARNKEFKELAHNLAMQIVAMKPSYIKPEDIPQEVLDKEKEIYQGEVAKEKKPPQVLEKIIAGKLEKFYENVCLLKQLFIKDQNVKIEDLIKAKIAKLGENIQVKRFVRYEI